MFRDHTTVGMYVHVVHVFMYVYSCVVLMYTLLLQECACSHVDLIFILASHFFAQSLFFHVCISDSDLSFSILIEPGILNISPCSFICLNELAIYNENYS